MKKLIKISRPRFWIYLFGPFLIGLAVGGINRDYFSLDLLVLGLYFLFPANFLLYGINDIFDYATDKLNPKKKKYEELVTPKEQKRLFQRILLLTLPFFIYSVFISLEVGTLLGLFVLLSLQYSSPPIRAKSKPFLDMVFNGLYIIPGIISYFIISGTYPSPLIIFSALFWTMAMHAYSAVPDISVDRNAHIQTIATQLGFTPTLYLCLVLYIISALLIYPFLGVFAIFVALIYVTLMSLSLMSNETDIFSLYKKFPIINTIVGGLLFFYLLLK